MTETTQHAAVVGAGNMGGAMVARLCERGWRVAACDIDPARCEQARAAGATIAATAREAARALVDGGLLIICVVDADQSDDVLFGEYGAAAALRPGHAVLLCPTMAPTDVERVARTLGEFDIVCIDAPMSGGPARARDGSMSLMLAAPDAVLARHDAMLADLAAHRFHIGPRVGDAARTKLVNNLLAGINLVGAAEAIAMAEHLGLDAAATLDVIEQSSGQSWIGSDRMRRALAGDFAARAHVTLLEKDTRLAVAAAREAGYQGPLGEHAARVFEQAHAAGLADLDDGALLTLLRKPPAPA